MDAITHTFQEDASALLNRALLGKTLSFFGEDGNGQYGQDYFAHHCPVNDVTVFVKNYSDDAVEIDAVAMIFMDGYSAKAHGHAATDINFRLSLNTFLKAQHIDPTCLDWATEDEQGESCTVMKIDLGKLLEW
jgi:hypothetical protein